MRLFTNYLDTDLQRARKLLQRHMEHLADDFVIEELSGGASKRSYFRVFLPRMPVNNSAILTLLPERFKLERDDFYQVAEILRKINLPVPQIYEAWERDGAYLVQDVGDAHLCDLIDDLAGDEPAIEALYRQAIDHVIVMQTRAASYAEGIEVFRRAFDEEKLLWELEFMMKHFAAGFAGFRADAGQKRVLDAFFGELVEQIAALPRVFCHRDYHSRNLMLWNEQLYILDFQDARMGPHVYDLVSLLGDSYAELSAAMRHRLLEYYIERHPDWDTANIRGLYEQYTLMALQRHLKHLGTFGWLAGEGDESALEYVPLTLKYLEENLAKFEETGDAATALNELFMLSRQKLAERE